MARMLMSSRRQIGVLSEVDLRNMRVFRQVADAGGITAAVDRFGLEKTAVSRALRALEVRLDGTLCARGPKGFSLTEYGRQVYAAAAGIEDAVDRARSRINVAHRTLEGEVRVALTDNCLTNPEAKISDAIEHFFRLAPSVRVSLAIVPPEDVLRALRDRRAHLGIVSVEHTDDSVVSEPIFAEETSLYCCPQTDETPPHLERLVARGYGIVLRRFRHAGLGQMSHDIAAAWSTEASGLEAVATLINSGRCVGFLPDHYVMGTRTRRPFLVVPGSERFRALTAFSVVHERDRVVSQAVAAMYRTFIEVGRYLGSAPHPERVVSAMSAH